MVGKMTRKSVRNDNYGLFHEPKRPTWRNNPRNSLTLLGSMDIFTGENCDTGQIMSSRKTIAK